MPEKSTSALASQSDGIDINFSMMRVCDLIRFMPLSRGCCCKNDNAVIGRDTGQFWMKMNEYVRGTVPKVKMSYVPVLCMHCDDAPCIPACPIEGAIYRRDDGLVIIDPKKCTGCMNCVDACPYGCIYFNEDLNLAQKFLQEDYR